MRAQLPPGPPAVIQRATWFTDAPPAVVNPPPKMTSAPNELMAYTPGVLPPVPLVSPAQDWVDGLNWAMLLAVIIPPGRPTVLKNPPTYSTPLLCTRNA